MKMKIKIKKIKNRIDIYRMIKSTSSLNIIIPKIINE